MLQLQLCQSTRWSQNATTVVGSSNGLFGLTSTRLNTNRGLFITDDDTLYIADTVNDRIAIVRSGSPVITGTFGSGPGTAVNQFQRPFDVSVTETSIYVLDTYNYRVQKWTRAGSNPVTVVGITGIQGTASSNTTIGTSYNLFVDKYDNVFVSDTDNHRVMRFEPNISFGVRVAGTGVSGAGSDQLTKPEKIFVDGIGTLYIVDSGNARIQCFIRQLRSNISLIFS